MTRKQLLKGLRKLAKEKGLPFSKDTGAGKGSHIKVSVGQRSTIIKDGELSPLYCKLVKQQLGLE